MNKRRKHGEKIVPLSLFSYKLYHKTLRERKREREEPVSLDKKQKFAGVLFL